MKQIVLFNSEDSATCVSGNSSEAVLPRLWLAAWLRRLDHGSFLLLMLGSTQAQQDFFLEFYVVLKLFDAVIMALALLTDCLRCW